jgi:hypothetical protein
MLCFQLNEGCPEREFYEEKLHGLLAATACKRWTNVCECNILLSRNLLFGDLHSHQTFLDDDH